MKFQRIKPFVSDLVSALFITAIITFHFVWSGDITIHIEFNILTVSTMIIVLLYVIRILNNTVIIGLKALFDFVLKKTVIIDGKYVTTVSLCRSSVSTERVDKKLYTPEYYKIIIESDNNKYSVLSSDFEKLEQHKTYTFEVGKYSHILLEHTQTKSWL